MSFWNAESRTQQACAINRLWLPNRIGFWNDGTTSFRVAIWTTYVEAYRQERFRSQLWLQEKRGIELITRCPAPNFLADFAYRTGQVAPVQAAVIGTLPEAPTFW
jgi:hypothetical protein